MTKIRVASVPSGHIYIRHLAGQTSDGTVRLADPAPRDLDPAPGQWWPPAMLNPDWLKAHRKEFDLCHVHFGFDALSADELLEIAQTLQRLGKPLVYTAHDLRNPHHERPAAHDAHLDVLMATATTVVTLTPGAADEIERRWGRSAVVLPHPHVVDVERMQRRTRHDNGTFTVGVHAKSLRPSMDPVPVLGALLPLVDEFDDLRLVVDVHPDVFDEDGQRHDPRLRKFLIEHSESGRLRLAVHDCYTDDELWDYLQSLDVSVLPYRFGTHSGWLEACSDLGTTVVAPDCGYIAEQRTCLSYHHDEQGLGVESLQDSVRIAYLMRPSWRASVAQRTTEREHLAHAHAALYRAALA